MKGLLCNIPFKGNKSGRVNIKRDVVALKLSLGLSMINQSGMKKSNEK